MPHNYTYDTGTPLNTSIQLEKLPDCEGCSVLPVLT